MMGGFRRYHPALVFRCGPSLEQNGESGDNEKREYEIPVKSGTVPIKFFVSGGKNRPYAFQQGAAPYFIAGVPGRSVREKDLPDCAR